MKFKKQEFLRTVRKLNNYGRGVSGETTYYGLFQYGLVVSYPSGKSQLKAQRVGWAVYSSKEELQAICDRANEEDFKRGIIHL